jgi:hypothetical protein
MQRKQHYPLTVGGCEVDRPAWAPDDVDLDRPSVARVYDFFLGGSHNFAADRLLAEQAIEAMPGLPEIARGNRDFLRRAVTWLAAQGIRQFIDLGSGIPTVGNVHDIVRDAKVVYVDNDPVAIAHSRAMLADEPGAIVVQADLRKPFDVLADSRLRTFVDFREPVAFLLCAVLHFVPDAERPGDIVAGYIAAAVPGSYVVISHAGIDNRAVSAAEDEALGLYRKTPTALILRTRREVEAFFDDLTLVEPGVVPPGLWRPEPGDPLDPDSPRLLGSAGIGRRD